MTEFRVYQWVTLIAAETAALEGIEDHFKESKEKKSPTGNKNNKYAKKMRTSINNSTC